MPLKKIHQKITWALKLTPQEFLNYLSFRKDQILTITRNRQLLKNREKNARLLHSSSYLNSQLTAPITNSATFFFDPNSTNHINELKPHTEKILADAQKILNHEFDLLGSGPTNLGPEIPWHRDFKSGKTWPIIPASQIPYEFSTGNDIKVPWELSRFQHLPTLGQAHLLAEDSTPYAQEFQSQITDWIAKNPTHFGVNWKCNMDVAIRACNWIYAWYYFKDSPAITEEFKTLFYNSLNQHGKFIIRNLEKFPFTSNHYLANIIGLVYLGITFPEFKEATKWRTFGTKALEQEMQKQVYPDGSNFEASISYHRMTTEFFGYAALLCKLNKIPLNPEFYSRLEKMFEFTRDYTKPNSLAPMIGDFDDGRLHITRDYSSWNRRDHRHLFDLATQLFPNFAPPTTPNTATSTAYPDTGIYILRSPAIYLITNYGANGQNKNGGHAHNDTFSFELNKNGQDFFLDTGAYIYTPDVPARNHFRSTQMHNTVCIDQTEINPIDPNSPFHLPEFAHPKVTNWTTSPTQDTLSGSHQAYRRLNPPTIHHRTFKLDKKNSTLTLEDKFTESNHTFEWNFHLDPSVQITQKSPHEILLTSHQTTLTFISPPELPLQISPTEVSFSYGQKQPSKKITTKIKNPTPKSFTFKIF